jgi:hypothetical protein
MFEEPNFKAVTDRLAELDALRVRIEVSTDQEERRDLWGDFIRVADDLRELLPGSAEPR